VYNGFSGLGTGDAFKQGPDGLADGILGHEVAVKIADRRIDLRQRDSHGLRIGYEPQGRDAIPPPVGSERFNNREAQGDGAG
jgi:hypothetical protein